MSDGAIQLQPNSTGPKVDTSELTVGVNLVERQRIVIADNLAASGLAAVSAANGLAVDVTRIQGFVATTQQGVWSASVSGTVAVSNLPATQPVSGPLTDVQLRAAAVPVSGAFFQATQPVSLAALPTLPTGANVIGAVAQSGAWSAGVTGSVAVSNFPASQPVTGPLTDVQLRANVLPVSGAFFQATQPVSLAVLPTLPTGANVIGAVAQSGAWSAAVSGSVAVSNFPATQSVSGPLTDVQLRANAVPVIGAFFQATQPVSLTALPALPTGANTIGAISNSAFAATQATPANLQATVTQQPLVKAAQGATGVTTQDLKDAGRSSRTATLDSFAVAAVAETLNTFSFSADNGAPTTGTSYIVTAGKRLRLQQLTAVVHTIAGNTTAAAVILRLRVNNAGAAAITSPAQFIFAIPGIAGANAAGQAVSVSIPDGYELASGAGFGVTTACAGFVATTAAPKVDVFLIGFEY